MSGRRLRKSMVQSVPGTRKNMKTTGKNPTTYKPPPPVVLAPPPKKRESVREKEARAKRISFEMSRIAREGDDEKENQKAANLGDYTNMVRNKCVLTERWMVLDPQHDPSRDKHASLVMETDVTVEGELRVKRCVKIFDDRTYQVLVDSVDMTRQFDNIIDSQKLETTYDSDKLFHALMTKKVCQGLRTFDPTNPILIQGNLPVKQRGKLWYSTDCTVIVQKVFMGNSCNACMKIRNQVRRCLQNDTRKKSRRPAMKQVKSTFGKALYSLLNDFSGRGPIPPSQYSRDNMVYDEKLGIHISLDLHQRLFIAATMPPPPMPPSKNRNRKNRRGSTRSRYQQPTSTITSQEAYPIQQFITEDGQVCYVANVIDNGNMGEIQYGMPMMVEKFEPPEMGEFVAINENGNIIIQNVQGQEFQLAEGQEYELIGEATVGGMDPIEIIPADNQNIQIFEVDDATMQQIEVHGSMDDMRIASVDPNDPNLTQLFRAFQSQVQGLAL